MSIQVTCPGCLKRFNVSDKFAGKTGPCPSCQKPIKIPEKTDEVVIHAPEDTGPKDSSGKSILNPIRRKEVKLGLPVILGASLGAFATFAVAFGLGLSGEQPPTVLLVVASVLLAPPLVIIGYWFLRDDELEGFQGSALWGRCGVCSLAFAALWAFYAFVPGYISNYSSMAENTGLDMVVFIPLMIALGTVVSVAALELEIVQGGMLYTLYLGVTFVLAWLAGTHLASPLSGGSAPATTPPINPPGVSEPENPSPVTPPPPTLPDQKVPNLLQ